MGKNSQGVCRIERLLFWLTLVVTIILPPASVFAAGGSATSLVRFNTPGEVTLEKNKAEYTVKVPVPERWLVEEVILRLAFVNSSALLATRSQLVILCNRIPVTQVGLIPEAPEGVITAKIPVSLLKTGYNDLTFRVAQDIKDEGCIPPNPPEVWTSLKLFESSLEITHDLKEVPLSLASVTDFLFDPRMHEKNEVHLVLPDYDPQSLELAVLAASGVAMHFDYRDVRFSLGNELQAGVDNILLGDSDFVKSFLARFDIVPGEENILINHLPVIQENMGNEQGRDRRHALISLTGSGQEDLRKSVTAFSTLSFPLPDIDRIVVRGLRLPEISRYSGRNVLQPGKEYTLKELGWYTSTFQGDGQLQSDLDFIVPSDLSLEANRYIELLLNLDYGARMGADSVLGLYVNDTFLASLPLDSNQGSMYHGYRVLLPLTYVKPGRNTLSLRPVLTPLASGVCSQVQTRHLAVTVFDDSKIKMPDVPHYIEMPHLEYLLEDGFPLAGMPDFRDTDIVLPVINQQSVTAMINMVTLISQRVGVQPFKIRILQTLPEQSEKNLLLIGTLVELPEKITESSPIGQVLRMDLHGPLPGSLVDRNWLDMIRARIYPDNVSNKPVRKELVELDTQVTIGRNKVLICEYESPLAAMQSVVLVTADRAEDLVSGIESLGDPEVKQQLRGDTALIDFKGAEPIVWTAKLSAPYHSGEYTARNLITYWVTKVTWWFYVVLFGLLLLLSVFLTVMVKRRRKRRLLEAEIQHKSKPETSDETENK